MVRWFPLRTLGVHNHPVVAGGHRCALSDRGAKLHITDGVAKAFLSCTVRGPAGRDWRAHASKQLGDWASKLLVFLAKDTSPT